MPQHNVRVSDPPRDEPDAGAEREMVDDDRVGRDLGDDALDPFERVRLLELEDRSDEVARQAGEGRGRARTLVDQQVAQVLNLVEVVP